MKEFKENFQHFEVRKRVKFQSHFDNILKAKMFLQMNDEERALYVEAVANDD